MGISEKYTCEDCKITTKAVIKKRIEKPPKHLIIHLKRFAYPNLKKDRALVDYKHQLDIGEYTDIKEENGVPISLKYCRASGESSK